MANRRSFIKNIGAAGAAIAAFPLVDSAFAEEAAMRLQRAGSPSPDQLATDEDFWSWVRHSFTASSSIINMNNGGVSPHPLVVRDAVERFTRMSNEAPSYYMWRVFEKGRELVRTKLAELAGVSAEEIAINRNTTEALDTIIFGIDLKKGDEVVHSNFIYPNMNQAWMQREMREGVVRKIAKLPMPSTDDSALVKAYTDQFTSRTKVVHITHLINWTGQVMPVAAIAKAAKDIGALVIVDGAHTFAHLDYKIPDLNCDFFGTSLHKWLCAPFGTGMVYVKKERIADLWPLFPNPEPQSTDIRKFEAQGTRSVPAELAIGQAVDFHNSIGIDRKAARLHYLKNYWAEKVSTSPKVKLWCPLEASHSGALTTVGIEGKSAKEVHDHLFRKHRIHTTTISHEGVEGVRITPNIYSSLNELDLVVEGLNELI